MTWEVGDLALCVDDVPRAYTGPRTGLLKAGKIYRVVALQATADGATNLIMDCIAQSSIGWRSDRFRKILPDKHEDCEPEFVTLLQRIRIGEPA